ncbi:unnamed protein product [Rotaria magnacalcarata]|uniref:protein-tyrosine-phosphatase n=3 Tax=Rotaria magnacalcarata TaxID=392030 RepID=A0A820HB26_9BILA|nr:unnamed protein product [Rotaria magnacalcarata]CAF1574249.1 unnamed protein product [Rotaria magnacalcarata]CAF2115285.1 unnamed protein product [Rotaria magnacalcarata]CAF2117895.1 unnamed protein product [Rotaria magnacalcarata]CAF2128871.1 unnamed protein product [Rotaria magnacalcarata]
MFNATQTSSGGAANFNQALAHEARLNRIHRLFKTHFNVTEPSIILEPYLFLGNCISAHDVHRLSRLGIRYVLNVAKRDVEVCPYYSKDMRTLTIDLRDDDRENIVRAFDQAFSFIDEARRVKSRVLVHCSHGQSRSPAIVIGYLMRTYNISLEQCLIHVVKARPCVIPNDGFLKQLILYDRFLVEKRRHQEEAAVMEAVKNAPVTEIPIQHYPPVASQHVQTLTSTKSNPSSSSISNVATISSVNSSSMASSSPSMNLSSTSSMALSSSSSLDLSSTSSIPSSESTASVRVIPIQVASKTSSPAKSEPTLLKKISTDDDASADEINVKDGPSKEKPIAIEQPYVSTTNRQNNLTPHNVLVFQERSSAEQINEIQQFSHHLPRSTVDHHDYSYGNHHHNHNHHHPVTLTQEQWDFINNIPSNYKGTTEHAKTKYITEIYDRATNRFIPTTRCY